MNKACLYCAIIVALTVQLTTAQAVAAVPANLVGTWSTGPGAILTGPGFINIKNNTFITPPITGLSYSFGANGSFEEAIYIQPTNASYPGCVTSTMFWQHGKFTYFTGNRSIITSPVAADGRLGLYNPCIPSENGLAQFYYQPETFKGYNIVNGQLILIHFDGSLTEPMNLIYTKPIFSGFGVLSSSVPPGSVAQYNALVSTAAKGNSSVNLFLLTLMLLIAHL